LSDLVRVILDETERNPEFREKVLSALGQEKGSPPTDRTATKSAAASDRPKNRRMAATLDPIELAGLGETTLRSRLSGLTINQLQDIVSDYAMDPGRLVTKWKTPERIIDRIVELALARAQKGNAFRADT
jgi:hypothetical protein